MEKKTERFVCNDKKGHRYKEIGKKNRRREA
jgi:hypothetical protein